MPIDFCIFSCLGLDSGVEDGISVFGEESEAQRSTCASAKAVEGIAAGSLKQVKQVAEVVGWPLCGVACVRRADTSIGSGVYFKRHNCSTMLTESLLDSTRLDQFYTGTSVKVRYALL